MNEKIINPQAEARTPSEAALKIGRTIRQFRQICGLSRKEFANDIGTSPSFVPMLEWGLVDSDICTLERCALAFNMKLSDLLSFQETVCSTLKQEEKFTNS
ncbi:MAG: hypothetical protein K2Z81_21775 [Cyanobacteria bacterium]|nr:hypothetical protein [Cyanobacteriota bacterium]